MVAKTSTELTKVESIQELPILPLRDVVVFPHMVIPLFVGRKKSIQALEMAASNNKQILLCAQKNPNTDDPSKAEMFEVGCVANILQMLKLPDGTIKVLVEGTQRAKVLKIISEKPCFVA